ncbi:MAG: S8 family serine peptidase [Candidatus Coatesbacteria bacterium]|nr:S8 family serine peptidase [Candidatus Coatesbacteria bacterium]
MHRVTSSLILSILLCLFLPFASAKATEIAVALSPRAVRGVTKVVSDGAFVPDELEAFRVKLGGGPVEQVFPGREPDGRRGEADGDGIDLALIYKFSIQPSKNALNAAYQIGKIPGVEWAEPIFDLPPVADLTYDYGDNYQPPEPEYGLISTDDYVVPNDPLFSEQSAFRQMHFPEAWAISTGSTQLIISTIDSGYSDDHPDLMGSLWDNPEEANGPEHDTNGFPGDVHGWNFRANTPDISDPWLSIGHGVACSSVYGARANNGIGIAGAVWDASVMVTIYSYLPYQMTAANAIVYAADNGAGVMQASIGGTNLCCRTGLAAFEYAREKGLLMFAAAGNFGIFLPFYPAGYPSVLSVAGTDRNDVLMGSNYGHWAKVSAPLDGTMTCTVDGGYGPGGGTSIATPHAASVGALLRSVHPDWDPDMCEAHLRATGTPVDARGENIIGERNGYEAGPRLDAYAALSTEPEVVFSPFFWAVRPHYSDDAEYELVFELENTWKAATDVHLVLSCEDPMVSILSDECDLDGMKPLEIKRCEVGSFVFTIPDECPANHACEFVIDAIADEITVAQRMTLSAFVNSAIFPMDGWPGPAYHAYGYPPVKADLNGDGISEVLCPTSMSYFVLTAQGELIDEIPVVPGASAPAVADIDGDLADEIIFSDFATQLHVFDAELGILNLVDWILWGQNSIYYDKVRVSTADLCGNSGRQILLIYTTIYDNTDDLRLGAFKMDGTVLDGFPLSHRILSRNVAVADFDGDGSDEIGFLAENGFYIVDGEGEPLSDWPHELPGLQINPSGPAPEVSAGDIDGDGLPEMLGTVGGNRVFALRFDGSLLPGWPFEYGAALFETHPVLADVNGDSSLEVILVEFAPSLNATGRTGGMLHLLDASAHELPGWPLETGIHRLQPPIACDVNGDGKQNILFSSTRGVFAIDDEKRLLEGWPVLISADLEGTCSYAEISVDDFDDDGTLDLGVPMEGRYFMFSMEQAPVGNAGWGYRGRSADMRFAADAPALKPSITIEPTKETYLAGIDNFRINFRITNPGEERIVIASAWVEVEGSRFGLPDLGQDVHSYTLTLPAHSSFLVDGLVDIPLSGDLPPIDVAVGAALRDAATTDLVSSPVAHVRIMPYVPPTAEIVLEGPAGDSYQTFSYNSGLSSLKSTPLWIFDDGETTEAASPGHLFLTDGEHQLGLILTDEVGSQFLATASTIVMEPARECGDDMASMGSFCIDIFEASRSDATAYSRGVSLGAALSVKGVLPWQPESTMEAVSACAQAGKRLCTITEWQAGCKGSLGETRYIYPYGTTWEFLTCNDWGSCRDGAVITGLFDRCVSRVGVHDMLGNVRELVTDEQGMLHSVAGGSTHGHPEYPTCESGQGVAPQPWGRELAYGFRCCKDAE